MPPRKRTSTATRPRPVDTDLSFEPVRITTSRSADTVPLFYIDDTEYRVPAKVPQTVVLEFLRLQRTQGDDFAAQRLLERLLGPEAYEALEQSGDIDDEQFEQVMRAAVAHVAGPAEQGKDRS
jgi:hypothetical protein